MSIIRRETTAQLAQRFQRIYVKRLARTAAPTRPPAFPMPIIERKRRAPANEDLECLRQVMLEQVTRHPVKPTELFQNVRDNYGRVNERRLWRTLNWLRKTLQIEHVGRWRNPDGYRRIEAP